MTSLPIAARVRVGVRFAEVDAPVVHVPGAQDIVPRAKSRKASPTMLGPLGDIEPEAPITVADFNSNVPVERFAAFVIERFKIWQRKETGAPWPWTDNQILRDNIFDNVHRAHDRTTQCITANVVVPHQDNPDLPIAVAAARFINNVDAVKAVLPYLLPFDGPRYRTTLEARPKGSTYRTEAYKPPLPPRALKGMELPEYHTEHILEPMWRNREALRWRPGDTLGSWSHRLERNVKGIGSFLAGQIVADTKQAEPWCSATDHKTFVRIGPGSARGLNRLLGRDVDANWSEPNWRHELAKKHAETKQIFADAGFELDLQDFQNCCCEWDKHERIRDGGKGRPYRLAVEARKQAAKLAAAEKKPKAKSKTIKPEATPVTTEPSVTPPATAATSTVAAVKFIITQADKAALRARGFSDAQIAELTPQQASDILARRDDWALVERGGKDLLDAGLRAAARGWAIFPCTDGKKPLVKWKQAATTDPTTITAWAAWPRTALWARALPADVLLIDLDNKHGNDGIGEFERLQGCHPDQFEAPRVITGSGGRHLYTNPFGRTFKNSVGRIDDKGRLVGIAPGVDTKTLGGYCIIPSGNGRYRWLTNPDTPMPSTPPWAELVLRQDQAAPRAPPQPYQGPSPEGEAILERAIEAIISAPDGAREITHNNWALIVGHYVGGGLLERGPTIEALIAAAQQQGPRDAAELRKKITRAVDDGMRQPDYGEAGEWRLQEANRQAPEKLAELLTAAKPAANSQQQQAGAPQQTGAQPPKSNFSYELIRASAVSMRAVGWDWPGHLARGELEILTGPPDIGKSQVQCSFVAHRTTGRDWPDGAKGPLPCDVVMLTAEDNTAHTVCPRLAVAGADLDRVHILNKIRKDNKNRMFLLQEDLDVLEHILASNPAVGLVTIDPITAYLGGKLDSHRATDVRNQLGPLKELAERSLVAFSAITHPAKRPGLKALDHYIGSQAFIAAPRIGHICISEMEEDANGQPQPTGRMLFANPKHNIYAAMPTLAYRLSIVDGGRDATTGETIRVSRVEWAEVVGLSADQALAAAVASGKGASGPIVFLLDILANGPVAKKAILERAAARGFSADQLRRAREKTSIKVFKQPGQMQGDWFWALPSFEITQ